MHHYARPKALAFRRKGVSPMGVLIPDLPVGAMDNQLRALISRNLTSNINCFLLCSCSNGCSGITLALYLPSPIRVWYDMLIFGHSICTFFHKFFLRYSLSQRTFRQAAVPVNAATNMRSFLSMWAKSLSRTCTQLSFVLINQVDSVIYAQMP